MKTSGMRLFDGKTRVQDKDVFDSVPTEKSVRLVYLTHTPYRRVVGKGFVFGQNGGDRNDSNE
jgi:hypothetical protein